MGKVILLFSFLILIGGCANKGLVGSVDPSVRSYVELAKNNRVKNVSYHCDFDRIARQDFGKSGDYCKKPSNEDYVSYLVAFDIQSTNLFRVYLSQATASYMLDGTDYLEYFLIYAKDKQSYIEKAFNVTPPTSFAVQLSNSSYVLGITKRDLLARVNIKPTLAIRGLKPLKEPTQSIKDYALHYSVMPYNFASPYDDPVFGRVLGAVSYAQFVPLKDTDKKNIARYNSDLNEFWNKPYNYKSSQIQVKTIDYALPQVGAAKFVKKLSGDFLVDRPIPPKEGLLPEYLPEYELQSIIIETGDGVIKKYARNELIKMLISIDDDDALLFKYTTSSPVKISYYYKSIAPAKVMDKNLAEKSGVAYIYSDIANYIVVDLNIENYYKLENLPANCIDKQVMQELLAQDNPAVKLFISSMPVYKTVTCSYNQKSIAANLIKFL